MVARPVVSSDCCNGAVSVSLVASSPNGDTLGWDWVSLPLRRDAPRAIHQGCKDCIWIWSAATKAGGLGVAKPQVWWSLGQTARALPLGLSLGWCAVLQWRHSALGVRI